MNARERDRLTEAYRSMLGTLQRFVELRVLSAMIGPDVHEKRASKKSVQQVMILLDKFEYLDLVLREDNGDVCPHCKGDHPSYRIELSEQIRDFAEQVSDEEFQCTECWDLGWKHVKPGDCYYGNTSDNHYHIEFCRACCTLSNNDAVDSHAEECGCPYFRHDCNHYNDDNYIAEAPRPADTHVPKMLQESNEIMNNTKKITPAVPGQPAVEDKFQDVGIRFSAPDDLPTIILPEGMEFDQAIHWLKKNRDELEKDITVDHKFPGFYPPDAALALHKAIERTYGFVSQESRPRGWSIIPPETVGIESELGKIVQIPWGRMTFHGVKGYVETGVTFVDNSPVMRLYGVLRKGDQDKIEKLVLLTKEILRNESIYRGKAINIDFDDINPDDPKFDPMKAPKFIDLSKVKFDDLVLSASIYEQVEANLFVPIRDTQGTRDMEVSLRRSILLAGPYGTGKSLTALVTALLCVQNNWTYIYIDDLKQLPQALAFAKNYGPAVLFGEDIDRITEGERDEELDEYLNSLDGINGKHDEIMTVFTTNNIDNIHPAMMRPGRTDAIILIEPPDAMATMKLLHKYGGNTISVDEDLTKVSNMLAGQTPAIVREVLKRSKLRALRDKTKTITNVHLEQAATEMLAHVKYINKEKGAVPDPITTLGHAIGEKLRGGLSGDRLLELTGPKLAEHQAKHTNGNGA